VTAPSNHSPLFHIDESGIPLAARALAAVAVDYLASGGKGGAASGGAAAR
jgi:hypothetical protein